MRIFVYECVSAGGLGPELPASLRREGWAMLSAAVDDFQRLAGVEVVTLLDRGAPHALGHRCECAPDEEEWRRFQEIAGECDFTLVIAPESDLLLWSRCDLVVGAGGRLLGSTPAAIQLTGDKLATAEFWHNQGVPHPLTQALDPQNFASFSPPWVMKPRHGAGSQATFLIRNRQDGQSVWAPAYHESPEEEFIVQQYIRGQAASVALLISDRQIIPLLPGSQRLSMDGRFRYLGGSIPLPPELADRAIRVAGDAVKGIEGLQGYVGVDLVLGEHDEDYAIEINPRLTTSYIGLRRLCRQNLAKLMLQCACGERIESPTWHSGEVRFEAR